MKVISSFCLVAGLLIFASCNNSPEPNIPKDRINKKLHDDPTDSLHVQNPNMYDDGTKNVSHGTQRHDDDTRYMEIRNADRSQMYNELGLKKDQINRIEKQYQNHIDTLRADTSKAFNRAEIQRQQDQIMKEQLNNEQFGKYTEWKKKHNK